MKNIIFINDLKSHLIKMSDNDFKLVYTLVTCIISL